METRFTIALWARANAPGADYPTIASNKDWYSGEIRDYTERSNYGFSRTSGQLPGWAIGGNFAAQNMGIGHIFTLSTALHFFVRSETPKTGGVRRTLRDRVLQAGSRPSAWRGQAISIYRTLRKQSKLHIPNSREMHCFPYGPRQKR